MISQKVSAHNFGSYSHIEIDFENHKLTLISGPTGAGKSTLQDLVPWILFGRTAKDGLVDDIRPWHTKQDTYAYWTGKLSSGRTITIHRVRGDNRADNDLYWTEHGYTVQNRGKDAADTQKKLQELIGFDFETYVLSAYFNEFSSANTFFLAKAKQRRDFFESLVPLEFCNNLELKSRIERIVVTKELSEVESNRNFKKQVLYRLDKEIKDSTVNLKNWKEDHKKLIATLKEKSDNFEQEKQSKLSALEKSLWDFEDAKHLKVHELSIERNKVIKDQEELLLQKQTTAKCSECGSDKALKSLENTISGLDSLITSLQKRIFDTAQADNPYVDLVIKAKDSVNEYDKLLEIENKKVNPFEAKLASDQNEYELLKVEVDSLWHRLGERTERYHGIEQLLTLSQELRKILLVNTIRQIEHSTNKYMEKVFDAEFRVAFDLADSNSLDITIKRDGVECSYSQLSRGQRQLLKLCFAVSVMPQAANSRGLHFSTLFFDEALDGLDTTLKLKAFQLFQELSTQHDNVFVIDHDANFKELFDNTLNVELVNGLSQVQ